MKDFIQKKLNDLKLAGNYRYFKYIQKDVATFPIVTIDGKDVVNFCTNDYLCTSICDEVTKEAACVSLKAGVGSSGTRNISGSNVYHKKLEDVTARMHKKESALLFTSAYLANVTTLSVVGNLLDEFSDGRAVFLSDEQNHSSMISGMKSSRAKREVFLHNDLNHLESLLKKYSAMGFKIAIAVESVYSISGDFAPLKEIAELAKQYEAITYLDEVHGVGLYGSDGSGYASLLGVEDSFDLINGTYGKAFGTGGGYVAGDEFLIDAIRSFGSGFIFTTSLAIPVCAATIKSIEYVKNAVDLRKQFFENVWFLKNECKKIGIEIYENQSHITRIMIEGGDRCLEVSKRLFDKGFYVQPINYPTVPYGFECLRVIVTPMHKREWILDFVYQVHKILSNV